MDSRNQRVVQGSGIFHTPKVKYSPETKSFLKELMEESRLTMLQRQKVNYSLRSGDPLPKFVESSSRRPEEPKIVFKSGFTNRRTLGAIKDSGAYERDKFVPSHPRISRDFAKKHLQDIMTFGKDGKKDTETKAKKKIEKEKFENRYEELKNEIQERVDWLADMEKLGEGYKHRQVIEQQIGARIREMEKLKIAEADSLSETS